MDTSKMPVAEEILNNKLKLIVSSFIKYPLSNKIKTTINTTA